MPGHGEIASRVLELLSGIDLEQPVVDEERASERLRAYVEALGLPAPEVRVFPDVRALRVARVWPGQDRGRWAAFSGRQGWLLDRTTDARWRRLGGTWVWDEPLTDAEIPPLGRLPQTDGAVLEVGLGQSRYVRGVRHVTTSLERVARVLLARTSVEAPKRIEALVPLAEAASSGLFAHAVGWSRRRADLVALLRPRVRLDEERRLHDWDGLPAAEWPNGRGLYFWHGVEMTESAGRDPVAVTPARVLGWANAERRRVAIERMGLETFMTGVAATVVQEDDYGRLWRTANEVDGEPFVAVEVVNSTREPDGSYRRYFLRVPPGTKTARRGVAWSFGLTRTTYAPVVES
jgi:hypothetical protein